MLPPRFIERHLAFVPPELLEITLELRSLIASVAPTACEKVHPRGFTYFDGARGGPVSAGICQIGVYKDHVRLAFVHGAFLPDPKRLLEGDRIAKRFVRICSYQAAPWEDLKRLIRESVRFDPRALGASSTRSGGR